MKPGKITLDSPGASHLNDTFSYALTGCNRVAHLIGLYHEARKREGKTRGRVWTHLSDILRAAVVLCHANLEQVLRDLILVEAEWSREFLQRVPLPGGGHVRADRFSLADLEVFGDQPVREVVFDAVFEHLSKRSFTSVGDLVDVLKMCGVALDDYQEYFPDIAALMERRHHIAHTADLEVDSGRGKQMTRSISAKTVERWNRTTFELYMKLSLLSLPNKKPNNKGYSEG
jgi:hypothetical protein